MAPARGIMALARGVTRELRGVTCAARERRHAAFVVRSAGRAEPAVRTDRFDERVVDEVPDLSACGANYQGACGFENHRRGVEEGLKQSPKSTQHLLAAVPRRGFLKSDRPRLSAGFFENHTAARQGNIDQDLADFSALSGQPSRQLGITDFLEFCDHPSLVP
jgi:hypothetical protein